MNGMNVDGCYQLERCLSRLARVEGQYLTLVAETNGQEATLDSCLKKAKLLVINALTCVRGGSLAQALDEYDAAIKVRRRRRAAGARGGLCCGRGRWGGCCCRCCWWW